MWLLGAQLSIHTVAPCPIPTLAGTIETNVANDAHIGNGHGWVEWVRVVVDEQCVIATPMNPESRLESWRPILEYGGGGVMEWATLTAAWAEEWVENKQFP